MTWFPPGPKPLRDTASGRQVKIVADGAHVEHWLNGKKVLEYELWTSKWYEMLRDSKVKCDPEFGDAHEGYIGLQDHGTRAQSRNIKIKELDDGSQGM